jgi:hypothetical protein
MTSLMYAHSTFGRKDQPTNISQPSIIRLGILLLLFDVYLTWARIEKQAPSPDSPESSNFGRLAQQPIVYQYIFFRKNHHNTLL